MKAVGRRLERLEERFQPPYGKPGRHMRVVVTMAGATGSLEDATCERALYPNGTLTEVVYLGGGAANAGSLTEEELDRWVAGFPIDSSRLTARAPG